MWEVCKKPRPKWTETVPRPYASINRRGEIALSEAAYQLLPPTYNVTLLYDAELRHIAVKFPVLGDLHFFPLRHYGRDGRLRVVRAARLLKQFGIDIEDTLSFTDIRREGTRQEPMLVLNLQTARPLKQRSA